MSQRSQWKTGRLAACLAFLGFGISAALAAAPCSPSSTALCLSGGRFEVKVAWTDFQGNTGNGQAIPLTADTGYFWFFSDTNVELVVKVLDARGLNGHFWVFYGALSNVQYELTVRDSQTGDVRIYDNPSGQFASTGDTAAFPLDSASRTVSTESRAAAPVGRPVDESRVAPSAWNSAASCVPDPTTLCLNSGRFQVEAAWKDFQGNTGVGHAVGLTSDTGYFWFFSSTNVEAVIKVLDGRPLNNYFWVFYGALSNVQYTLTVTDTVTGIVKTYANPSNLFASVGDTQAFGTPTTFQLIDGGVVKGEIDDETALLYKAYAFFGDSRLPQAYVGDPPGQQDHGIMLEVADRWSTLSAPTQQLLQPYLTPPSYPGSWLNGGSAAGASSQERIGSVLADWTTIPTANADVWYRAADAGAQTAANNLAAAIEFIWAQESDLMLREPRSDFDRSTNGGSGKLDIYVLPSFRDADPSKPNTALGLDVPYPFGSERTAPTFILIRISAASTVKGARSVLAHEFFHALAANTPLANSRGSYSWLNEATATWMEDFVYPTQIDNFEQNYAPPYFTKGYLHSLEDVLGGPPEKDGGYSDYLFFFYLARSLGPQINHLIWINVSTMSSLQAVADAIPGGFEETWPNFALQCWNQPSVDKFTQWDQFPYSLSGGPGSATPSLELTSGSGSESLAPRSVPPRAMSYAYLKVDNDAIKRVEIQTQKPLSGSGSPKVQAWIKLSDGTTRIEDWTSKDKVVFCRDKASEAITELLILSTNGASDKDAGPFVWDAGKVVYDSVGCGGFRGTVRESRHVSQSGQEVDETMDSTATFLPNPEWADHYYLAAITMVYSYVGHDDLTNCTLTVGPVTQTATFQFGESDLNELVIDTSTQPPTYSATGNYGFIADARGECPGQPGGTVSGPAGGVWWNVPPDSFRVNADGTLSGDYTDTEPSGQIGWTWSFVPN